MRRHRSKGSHGYVGLVLAAMSVLAMLALGATGTAAAAEGGPRWAVAAIPTPTNLVPESPRTEIDQLAVEATGGSYRLDLGVQSTTRLPYNAQATEVEAAIDQVMGGKGETVVVTEVPGGPTSHVYRIEWAEAAVDRSLEGIGLEGVTGETKELTGGARTVLFKRLVDGASEARLLVSVTNVGGTSTDGSTITVSDAIPAGLTATEAEGVYPYGGNAPMTCQTQPTVSCSYEGVVAPGGSLMLTIMVSVAGGLPAGLANEALVSGGGAEPAARASSLPVSTEQAPFGVATGSLVAALSSTHAGAHPNITTAFSFNTSEPNVISTTTKDVHFDLPVGFVGNTVGMPRCSMQAVLEQLENPQACPSDSMVGMATVTLLFSGRAGTFVTPVYNIAPAPGEPAAFGFDVLVVPVRLDTSVLSNGNYGVRITAPDLNEGAPVLASSITIWGVPADHDGAGESRSFFGSTFGGANSSARVPLLSNPQQCTQPLGVTMTADPWISPGDFAPSEALSLGTPNGCNELRFSSSFSMVPDTLEAGAPAGYHFDLRVPQNNAPDGLATPNVKRVSLKLPVGTVVNPAAAQGLKACSTAQFYGPNHPSQAPASLAECPRESQVGTVQIKTPALEEALEGQVYLAEPNCKPCTPADAEDGKMVRLFVQAISEGEGGIVVKLEGNGQLDQQTGQITTIFDDNPQLPFSDFKLKLGGGSRAVLANPRTCGPATSSMDLTPWSTPTTLDSLSSYTFDVDQGCFGAQFKPRFAAGMPNVQAGANGEFTLAFGREDSDEYLGGIAVHMPEGLLGTLTGIPLCGEAQAIAGSCDPASQIGTVEALTGPGTDPFLVSGGHVYLTAGYGGSQFGLSIVVPAVAGPYTLGGVNGLGQPADNGTVVVRSQIFVDPQTAQLTIESGQLPSSLDSIPLQLKAVNVRINRPGFIFNPTSCDKLAITGTLTAVEGMTANVSSPFQVTNCAALAFKPTLTASTTARHSRGDGARLQVVVSSGKGQADIAKAKVELPKQLPAELKTLQQACTETQFAANPAGCPAGSVVGSATVETPVLPVPLQGAAYFVSHGGAKFPELIMVLQGYGVTVELAGETHIDAKSGITSTTLNSVPDVPFSRFVLTLPQGPHSALAANGNLCSQRLVMPTELAGQNGAVLKQSTAIEVAGCPSALSISSHAIKHQTLTLKVYVPAAGEVEIDAKGLTSKVARTKGREIITVRLSQKRAGRLTTKVAVDFTPSIGKQRKRQFANVTVKFKS